MESNYNIYRTPFRMIRRFIRVAKYYGYNIGIVNRHDKSCYVCFFKNGEGQFIFRFSDHWLGKNNYIPAGVINERTDLDLCINDIALYHSIYNKMSNNDKDELWTNRITS